MKTAKEILTCARELLSDPARWTKGAYARTTNKSSVASRSPEARCWCPLGAMLVCTYGPNETAESTATVGDSFLWAGLSETNPQDQAYYDALDGLRKAVGRTIPSWNDRPETTHGNVLAAFDRAIEEIKA